MPIINNFPSGGAKKALLQSKEITPTKEDQAVVPDEGYDGLSDVEVSAIPDEYADVSGVTATVGNVLVGNKFVGSDGVLHNGTMPDNEDVDVTLDTENTEYVIPEGKHSGDGKVSISTQTKSATPSTTSQPITPDSGKVLSSVTVNAMPTGALSTPSISVNSDGVITATSGVATSGYISSETTEQGTSQLSPQAGTTITPGTSSKTAVSSGRYTTGTVYVAGDSNLVASNIKSGVSIFGVTGTFAGSGGYIGNSIYAIRSSKLVITFSGNIDNSKLIGFYASIEGGASKHTTTSSCPIVCMFLKPNGSLTGLQLDEDGVVSVVNGLGSVQGSNGSVTITLDESASTDQIVFDSVYGYDFYPIYSS